MDFTDLTGTAEAWDIGTEIASVVMSEIFFF